MADENLVLRYLTDLTPATAIAGEDLLHLNQGGQDLSLTVNMLIRSMINSHYPVGKVILLANSSNPNLLFPGTTWSRVPGAGSTIRIANGDNDILQTGGTDSVILSADQMPSHTHYMSFNSQAHNPGQILTEPNGQHNHAASCGAAGDHQHQGGWAAPGAQWGTARTGSDNQNNYSLNWTSINGGHTHPVTIGANGNHQHGVSIPAHSHLIQGYTQAAGTGAAFSIVNRYIKLAAWSRSA